MAVETPAREGLPVSASFRQTMAWLAALAVGTLLVNTGLMAAGINIDVLRSAKFLLLSMMMFTVALQRELETSTRALFGVLWVVMMGLHGIPE